MRNIAEKMGVDTKDVLAKLKALGHDVKRFRNCHDSDDELVAKLTASKSAGNKVAEVEVTTTIVRRRSRTASSDADAGVSEVAEATPPVETPEPAFPVVKSTAPASCC